MAKLFLRTFGCQMNEYDSEKIADVLREAEGLEPAARPEDADLIVFNTCSVREKAQEKLFADLGRVKHLKRANPALMIAVGGCVASQEGPAIVERAPYVDVVFGPQTLHRLPELLARRPGVFHRHEVRVGAERPLRAQLEHLRSECGQAAPVTGDRGGGLVEAVEERLSAELWSWMRETDDPLLNGPIASPRYRLAMQGRPGTRNVWL